MTDYDTFSRSDFDPNEYANAVLAGEPYPAQPPKTPLPRSNKPTVLEPAKEDISVILAKLNLGIEDVAKQLKTVVTNHHEALLVQAAGASDLEESLVVVRRGLTEVTQSLEKLRLKIRVPYQTLAGHVSRLHRLQLASDVLRRTARFVIVARRLEFQMAEMDKVMTVSGDGVKAAGVNGKEVNGKRVGDDGLEGEKERNLAKAALSIAELASLLEDSAPRPSSPIADSAHESEGPSIADEQTIPLRSVNTVTAYLPTIEAARKKVTSEMENMVVSGLTTLNQPLLASSLQAAFNLRLLPELVQSLIVDLTETVHARIQTTFDVARISKEAAVKESTSSPSLMYKSRVRTEPTNLTAPQWTTALWTRLEGLIEDLASCCIKVYTLEKVLKMKKDAVSQAPFLDEAMKLLDNKPSSIFWTTLARSLEKQSRDAGKGSTFLQQTLSTGYPRFLRLFHDFFAKIAVHTDTVYSQNQQSPETVLVLHAVSNFEALYLARSLNRLNESVSQAMSGGARVPPGSAEGIAIARTIANELDSAKFDPLLVRAVAKNVNSALEGLIGRVDALIVRDRSATSMLGPTASQQLGLNAQLVTALYNCWSRLTKLEGEYSASVFSLFDPALRSIHRTCERTYDPLLLAIRREVSSIIARLHRVDFGKTLDDVPPSMGGASAYMKELVEKLSFVRKEVLSRYSIGEVTQDWTTSITKYVLRTFVNHVSIAKPLGESGKLQLTSDMTELEFALNAFMADHGKNAAKLDVIGDDYRALRALRPLLFLENARLALPEYTSGLPPLVVLHHILVRSPIPLPHSLHGWHEAEYVRWVDEHSEEESWTLIEGGLTHWEKVHEGEDGDAQVADEYIRLARTVLHNTKRVS